MSSVESNLVLLLRLIRNRADAEPLLRRGLTYSQISLLMGDAVTSGLLELKEGRYALTDAGNEKIESLKSSKKSDWIEPEDDSRIAPQPLDSVYLPKRKNSYFKV